MMFSNICGMCVWGCVCAALYFDIKMATKNGTRKSLFCCVPFLLFYGNFLIMSLSWSFCLSVRQPVPFVCAPDFVCVRALSSLLCCVARGWYHECRRVVNGVLRNLQNPEKNVDTNHNGKQPCNYYHTFKSIRQLVGQADRRTDRQTAIGVKYI